MPWSTTPPTSTRCRSRPSFGTMPLRTGLAVPTSPRWPRCLLSKRANFAVGKLQRRVRLDEQSRPKARRGRSWRDVGSAAKGRERPVVGQVRQGWAGRRAEFATARSATHWTGSSGSVRTSRHVTARRDSFHSSIAKGGRCREGAGTRQPVVNEQSSTSNASPPARRLFENTVMGNRLPPRVAV